MPVPNLLSLPIRQCDDWGCGHYGASRGDRQHNGVDVICPGGKEVRCGLSGTVTKLGYPYSDDLSFRYVQVTVGGNFDFRFFYVTPAVTLGEKVVSSTVIGRAQSLTTRYRATEKGRGPITEHVHVEIIDGAGNYLDPTPTLLAVQGAVSYD